VAPGAGGSLSTVDDFSPVVHPRVGDSNVHVVTASAPPKRQPTLTPIPTMWSLTPRDNGVPHAFDAWPQAPVAPSILKVDPCSIT
jgi:hypothetical protein